jgi:gamma-glutamylcyclotransferase (GGCT)/AIG2-like uncharacterized protein YtfP
MPLLAGGRRGSVRGQLRAVRTAQGCYPVLCAGQGHVLGRVYRARRRFGLKHLRLLDAYEDYDPRRPSRSEYRRQRVRVRVAGGGALQAHAYCYNRPVHPGLRVISGGDFRAYAARHRLRVFAA